MSVAVDAERVVTRLFNAVDAKDWQMVSQCFADNVILDYSSFGGAEAASTPQQAIIARWSQYMPGYDHTHHQIGNIDSKLQGEDVAYVAAHGIAYHVIAGAEGGETWVVVGDYDVELDKVGESWKIKLFRFNFKMISGNNELPEIAKQRAGL